jgi:hypothetical protein
MLPGRLLSPAFVRVTARRLLAERVFTQRASEIAACTNYDAGSSLAAELAARFAADRS